MPTYVYEMGLQCNISVIQNILAQPCETATVPVTAVDTVQTTRIVVLPASFDDHLARTTGSPGMIVGESTDPPTDDPLLAMPRGQASLAERAQNCGGAPRFSELFMA